MPQGRHIFPTLTTEENLRVAARKGVDGSDKWNLESVYKFFHRLEERKDSKGDKLSGGEKQMLAVARGLMQNPKMMLLDEITANLDAETEARVLEALRRASEGRTVLSVSHRIYENLGGRTVEIKIL